jgi:hypothetical protein
MATYYIDPSAGTNGTGTAASPFNTWTGVPVAAGNVYKQKRGTTWSGAFPSLTSGTVGNITTVTAYANADGGDSFLLPMPIIDIGDRQMPGTINSPKSGIKFSFVDLRNNRATLASDTPMMWLGDDVEFSDCALTTNLTALYGENRHRIKILRCKITAATAATATHAINAIVLGGNTAPTGVVIEDNEIYVGDGGPAAAHVIKISCATAVTDLQVNRNKIRTIHGGMTTHVDKAGIYLRNAVGADLKGATGTAAATIKMQGNDVSWMVDGIFIAGASNVWIDDNELNDLASFGVHVTGSTSLPSSGCIIEHNRCRRIGRNASPWYGRGIELSGGGQQHACTSHVIRFNLCAYIYNWGGPLDNATEGPGIGLDDATSFTFVYGNTCYRCEGQAVQTYGGSSPPADTGGNIIVGNWFIECGINAVWNRRSGGTHRTPGACGVSLASSRGSRTVVAYNLFVGGFGGLWEGSDCANVAKYGNVFIGQSSYAFAVVNTSGIEKNIYAPGIPRNIGNQTLNANNSPTPGLLSNGVAGDVTTDPLLDPDRYLPLPGSPLLSRSVEWNTVPYKVSDV